MPVKRVAFFMLPRLTSAAGAGKYFIEMARNVGKSGKRVDVITLNKKDFLVFRRLLRIFYHLDFFSPLDASGTETEEAINALLGPANWLELSLSALKKSLRSYDVIYTKNELVELLVLKMLGYSELPPIVVGVHTPLRYERGSSLLSKFHNFIYAGFVYRWLLSGVSCVHASNRYTKDFVERRFKVPCILVNYPFSSKEMLTTAKEYHFDDYDFSDEKLNCAFIARLGEQKGVGTLVRLLHRVAEFSELKSRVRFNIFGEGDMRSLVETAASQYEFVNYFGYVENRYVPSILSDQDLFISTSGWEVFPFNILEAQSMGVPVIAFKIPGPEDIIEHSRTGYLANDFEDFFHYLTLVVRGKVDFSQDFIIQRIDEKYAPPIIIKKFINMLEEFSN
ncbi:glycosyltransferase [candidate division WWE3 bacterium]|nr:glycosyltransferase [candidate division WWE3 bacterium]